MCSIDYEMPVSHSSPVFAHNHQPAGGFLGGSSYAFRDFPRMPSQNPPKYCNWRRQFQHSQSTDAISGSKPNPVTGTKCSARPKRPCLVIRSPEDSTSTSDDESSSCSSGAQSPTRNKKRVVFADDKGAPLTQVRVMTEPSSVPPQWMKINFLEDVTRGVDADPGAGTEDRWQITFAQPASDYVEFRKRLDQGKVSLENVIIKESDDTLVGTVKVKNIAFEKEVFVRSSINNWQTHEDTYCSYVPNSSATPGVNVIYDTFSFKMQLPLRTQKVEFCVCYRCNETEYWDNNQNKNYVVLKKFPAQLNKSLSADDLYAKRDAVGSTTTQPKILKYSDIAQAKLDAWSEFASWNHLENSHPYW